MASIITVHGTFAHWDEVSGPDGPVAADHLWWHPDSAFEQKMAASLAGGPDGAPVKIVRFIWNGFNSERERRTAANRLLERMLELERTGEIYCVIGHSHGGTVIANALLSAAARRLELPNMRQWISVGTPFIGMRPMPRLIDRLNLTKRVVLVASMMLLMMFIFFVLGQLLGGLSGGGPSFNGNGHFFAWRTLIAAAMMSVPVVFFTLVFRHFDRQSLFYHRVSTIARARTWFGPRWHSFCHPADEAVQGLHSLPDAKLQLFDRGFATQRLTLLSVAVLPLAYLVMLASPNLMLGVADVLKTSVYDVDKYASVAKSYDDERQRIRTTVSQATANVPAPAGTPPQAVAYVEARRLREVLKQRYPNYVGIERALRFKSEFLENDGKPCLDGKLCGGGRDFGVNSRLLYHVVTDDVTSALINDDTRFGIYGEAIRVAIPIVVVPAVFVSTALLAMLVIGWFSRFASAALAAILNRMTLAEIKREIYGNDTGTEVAYGAEPRPAWLQQGRPYLPPGLADLLTLRANAATIASISKSRNAISNIALSVGQPPYGGVVSNYLTWRELIHSSYLDYPEFQSLVACQMSTAEGFAPTPGFAADPSFMDAKATLDAMARSAPILSAGKLPSPLSPVSP